MSKFYTKFESDFQKSIISSTLLEEAVDWIKLHLHPDDVFDESELEEWARDNGFTKEAP